MLTNWIAALTMLQTTATTADVSPSSGAGLPSAPPAHRYVVDEAGLLDSAAQHVVDSLTAARAAAGMPIYILTIRSVAAHDSTDTSLEEFSQRVFRSWSTSHPGAAQAALLVVSTDDRRGHIETGPAWGREHDADLARILEDAINPAMARGSLDQGIPQATFEMTWVLKQAPVDPWLRDALQAGGVLLAGALVLGFLRRRSATRPVVPPAETEADPRPAAATNPTLRVSQRMQAIGEARKHSEKTASSITWLDTGEMPKFEDGAKSDSSESTSAPADPDDESEPA